ncbi:putative E3 ubiquitin-protein ligase UBR7 isoform X2 [Rosa chinensis]|uniref:putative E3 ubiquitin-protein ligase UBR7 isoform X2 n=1 Tax=Rosa chinensis TaxID=74649 RepID=UPI001AD8EBB1|nr:putative E3 ubiquitin-protein ligase UBR7 isoform X2 [Rosa chinensis]
MDPAFADEGHDGETVTIEEYLKDVEDQELEADLVLGGDEGKECTYNNGYMKRQAIFSCLTCTPDGNAGVCTACSLSCHDGHEIPRDGEGEPLYEDFICAACSKVCSFLRLYTRIILEARSQNNSSVKTGKDKEVIADEVPLACGSGKLENIPQSSTTNSESVSGGEVSLGENSGKNICSEQCATDADTRPTCAIGVDLAVASPVSESKPMFLSKNWRNALCRCEKCSEFYKQKHINFLIDKEDSIIEYEKMAKQKREEKLQQREGAELSMLDNLGHVEKIEILNGIADIKDELCSFLGSFDPSKAITSADVHQIFENLKKRRRVE